MTTATLSPTDLAPRSLSQRDEVTRLGLLMFLATVTMLFAAFTSAYLVRRSGSDWAKVTLPAILWLNTLVLVASSGTLETAWRAGRVGRVATARAAMTTTIALGLAFLAGQIYAWRQLIEQGVYLRANPFSSFFYVMTGAHAAHVVAALAVLLWGGVLTWRGDALVHPHAWSRSLWICRTFWHFLFGVWAYLFLLVSLV